MRFRGGVEDAYTIIYLLVFLAIIGIFGLFIVLQMFNLFDPLFAAAGIADQGGILKQNAINTFAFIDQIIGLALVLLIVGALALAFYSRGRPYIAILAVFIQIFYIIAAYFSKILFQAFISAHAGLGAVATQYFPITLVIMAYLPFICFITLMGIIVLFFTKPTQEYAAGI